MKILYLIPWVAEDSLINYEREFLPDDVDVSGLKKGILVECHSDLARTLPDTIDAIVDAEKRGYDAVVIACFGDSGVEVGRTLVDIPVLGPTNVGLHVASMIGHRTCLLMPDYKSLSPISRQNIILYGFEGRVVIRGSDTPVPVAFQAYDEYKTKGEISPFIDGMADICVRSIEEDDADVIVLGCGGIKWMKDVLESELKKKGYSMTVINPVPVTVEIARMLAKLKLTHSTVGHPRPPGRDERYREKDLTKAS